MGNYISTKKVYITNYTNTYYITVPVFQECRAISGISVSYEQLGHIVEQFLL